MLLSPAVAAGALSVLVLLPVAGASWGPLASSLWRVHAVDRTAQVEPAERRDDDRCGTFTEDRLHADPRTPSAGRAPAATSGAPTCSFRRLGTGEPRYRWVRPLDDAADVSTSRRPAPPAGRPSQHDPTRTA